jgi:hypothetical protein
MILKKNNLIVLDQEKIGYDLGLIVPKVLSARKLLEPLGFIVNS